MRSPLDVPPDGRIELPFDGLVHVAEDNSATHIIAQIRKPGMSVTLLSRLSHCRPWFTNILLFSIQLILLKTKLTIPPNTKALALLAFQEHGPYLMGLHFTMYYIKA
jgi:hypothetical protein